MSAELIVELIGVLSWPATVVFVVVFLRRQLQAALRRLARLEYGSLIAVFNESITDTASAKQPPRPEQLPGDTEDSETAPQLKELALDALRSEFPSHFRSYPEFWERMDLSFDAAAIQSNEELLVFDVIVLEEQSDLPIDRIEAVSERADALMKEYSKRQMDIRSRLIFAFVTRLSNDMFHSFESTARSFFRHRRGQEVRIFPEKELLRTRLTAAAVGTLPEAQEPEQ